MAMGITNPPASPVSIVSTVDEHGRPVDVAVIGSPEEVRSELAASARRWTRFDTPTGERVYLHPREVPIVRGSNEAGRFARPD
jgi:hypothetical protein